MVMAETSRGTATQGLLDSGGPTGPPEQSIIPYDPAKTTAAEGWQAHSGTENSAARASMLKGVKNACASGGDGVALRPRVLGEFL